MPRVRTGRRRGVRLAGLGAAVAVAAIASYQLPASPFDQQAGGAVSDRPFRVETPVVTPTAGVRPAAQTEAPITYPLHGSGSYSVLPGDPVAIGSRGRLLRFRIAIENGIGGVDRAALGRFVRSTYAAPQGWTAAGRWRFRQVGPGQDADYTLMFVTPKTRDVLCLGTPDGYTSCRIDDRVVLNIARWVHGVPEYGAPLATYRQYMLNHETGHRLGNGHELCPGASRPAPVMQQQTLGMHGCTPNAWPYRDRERYSGRLGQYDDPIPTD